jgi:hypothetical protein
MPQSAEHLKRTLRQLRKLEIKIRFKDQPPPKEAQLVWDILFSTKTQCTTDVKYPFGYLSSLDRQTFKTIVDEFFYRVYFQNFREHGLSRAEVYDPQLLSLLGLPPYASSADIKKRFRELAKRYHPDLGGDSEKFIALVEVYDRLAA